MSEAKNVYYFSEGQVWRYQTRSHEPESAVLINKIEYHSVLGAIFHISIAGVDVKNPHSPEPINQLNHFPVVASTLEQSLTELVDTNVSNPGFMEGYDSWREAFVQGKAGVFNISVSEIINIVEEMINKPDAPATDD
ncbi:hypothetical protein [Herpetosiphon giganteus]|uniref:hypothetical protein n=1 Tax=Herpetosiphon giganteus TaxID=2029754 RepID=UPI001958D60D|nr:hypothetical protein [Herpetosiphon giganteus]MBM7845441.1 hypothetical protein [Herpetosiphon giganteus]